MISPNCEIAEKLILQIHVIRYIRRQQNTALKENSEASKGLTKASFFGKLPGLQR